MAKDTKIIEPLTVPVPPVKRGTVVTKKVTPLTPAKAPKVITPVPAGEIAFVPTTRAIVAAPATAPAPAPTAIPAEELGQRLLMYVPPEVTPVAETPVLAGTEDYVPSDRVTAAETFTDTAIADINRANADIDSISAESMPWYLNLAGAIAQATWRASKNERLNNAIDRLEDADSRYSQGLVDITRANWYDSLDAGVPLLLFQYPELTVEDVISYADPQMDITAADRAYVQSLIDAGATPISTGAQPEGASPTTAEQAEALGWLLQPVPQEPLLASASIDMIRQQLFQTYPAVPEDVMSLEEATDFLRDIPGITEEEVQSTINSITQQTLDWSASWIDYANQMAEIRSGVRAAPIPARPSIWSTFTQPFMTALDLMNLYYTHVTRPIAGIFTTLELEIVPPWLRGWVFLGARGDMNALYSQARAGGANWWEAFGEAFENWDSNWARKLLIETGVDPLTYVGFGLYSGVVKGFFRAESSIGKFATGAHIGLIKVMDIPVDVIRTIPMKIITKLRIPELTTLQINKSVRVFTRDFYGALARATMETGDVFVHKATQPELLEHMITRSVAAAFDETAPAAYRTFGRRLVNDLRLLLDTPEKLSALAQQLGKLDATPEMFMRSGKFTATSIHKNVVLGLLEGKLPSKKAAASILLQQLNIAPTEKAMAGAIEWLEKGLTVIENDALRLGKLKPGETFRAVLDRLVDRETAITRKWLTSPIFEAEERAGKMALWRVVDDLDRTILRNFLDNQLVMPFARGYLTFTAYGIFNAFEGMFMQVINRMNPFKAISPKRFSKLMWETVLAPGIRAEAGAKGLKLWQWELWKGIPVRVAEETAPLYADLTFLFGTANWDLLPASIHAAVGDVGLLARTAEAGSRTRFLERIIAPKSLQHLFIDLPSGIGGCQRIYFVKQMVARELHITELFQKVIQELPILPKDIPEGAAGRVYDYVYSWVASGGRVSQLKPLLSDVDSVMLIDFDKVLNKYPELDSLDFARQTIAKGELQTTTEPEFLKKWVDYAHDDFIHRPDYFRNVLNDFRDGLPDMVLKSAEDVESLLQCRTILLQQADSLRASVNKTIWSFRQSTGMLREDIARTAFESEQAYLGALLETSTAINEKAAMHLYLLSEPQRLATEQYLTSWVNELSYLKKVVAKRTETYATGRASMLAAEEAFDWGPIFEEVNRIWDEWVINTAPTRVANMGSFAKAVRQLGGVAPTNVMTPKNPAQITMLDLAHGLTGNPDELMQALLKGLLPYNEDAFVLTIKAMLSDSVHPDYLKYWTDDVIRNLYRQLKNEARASVGGVTQFEQQISKIDSCSKELYGVLDAKPAYMGQVERLSGWLDEADKTMVRLTEGEGVGEGRLLPVMSLEEMNSNLRGAITKAVNEYHRTFANYDNPDIFNDFMRHIFPFWSISEDTEVLTRLGWRHYWELTNSDELLSLDKDTMTTYWDKIEYVNVYDYDGDALQLKDKCRDFIFTPNHWWLIRNQRRDCYEFVQGSELQTQHKFPKAVEHNFSVESLLDTIDATILGWLVTDGTIRRKQYAAYIQQSKQPYVDEIRKLLQQRNVLGSESIDDNGIYNATHQFRLTSDYRKYIVRMLDTYGLMFIVTHLSADAAEAMWDAMWKAEGCNQNGMFTQKAGSVLDAFEMLSFLTGRWVSKTHHQRDIWRLRVHKTKEGRCKYPTETVHYTGKMWCPRVEHRTILIRRNGKITWTGNTYEAYRWAWLPGEAIRHPGIMTSVGRYMDSTDTGYIHIPHTDLEFNPLRGTVFMGGFRRLMLRDFPEFNESIPGVPTIDMLGRYGFYPGIQVMLPLQIMGQISTGIPLLGSLLPPTPRTLIDMAVALGVPSAAKLQDTLFGERFRDYFTIQVMSKECQQRQLSYNGTDIWRKKRYGVELTPEEQGIWDRATRQVGVYDLVMTQGGIFRLRPQERIVANEQATQAIYELTGITPAQQADYTRRGIRIQDIVPLDPMTLDALYELDRFKYWTGMLEPILPYEVSKNNATIDEFWSYVRDARDSATVNQQGADQKFLIGYTDPTTGQLVRLTPASWAEETNNNLSAGAAKIDNLLGTARFPEYNSETNKGIPVTPEEQVDYYQYTGRQPAVRTPLDQILDLWYSIKVEKKVDLTTGVEDWDWDSFFAKRYAILNALTPEQRQQFNEYTNRNDTELVRVFQYVNYQYLRPYWNIMNFVLQNNYTPEEQALITEYSNIYTIDYTRRTEIESITRAGGNNLISSYTSAVATARQKFRVAYPEVDYWLWFFRGYTPLTPSAEYMVNTWSRNYRNTGILTEMQNAGYYWDSYEEQPATTIA